MANLHLVTGYAGMEHITSNDQGSFNAAIMGTGEFVLERGKQFEAQVISNNTVRVFDGDLLMQGRHIRLKENTYVDLFFENGIQGYKRTDLIVVRYEKDPVSGIESASLAVIKGVPTQDAYVSSEKVTGNILNDHALQNDMVLYRVKFDGLAIQEPEKVFSAVPTWETLKNQTIKEIELTAEKSIQKLEKSVDEALPLLKAENPTSETKGKLKQFFVNTETGELFICTDEGESYNWVKVGATDISAYDSLLKCFICVNKLYTTEHLIDVLKPDKENSGYISIPYNSADVIEVFTGKKASNYTYRMAQSMLLDWQLIPLEGSFENKQLSYVDMIIDKTCLPRMEILSAGRSGLTLQAYYGNFDHPLFQWYKTYRLRSSAQTMQEYGEQNFKNILKSLFSYFMLRIYMIDLTNTPLNWRNIPYDRIDKGY